MLTWMKEKKEKVSNKLTQTLKKQIYLSIIAISTVLILSLVGFNAHSNHVFAQTAREDMQGMITSLDTMSSSVTETQKVITRVYEVDDSSGSSDVEESKPSGQTNEIDTKLETVQGDISDTKEEIEAAINDIDEGNTKDLKEVYEKISKDFEKTTETFNTSMDDVKEDIEKLSKQSKKQYEGTIEQISAVQDMLEQQNSNSSDDTNTILESINSFGTSLNTQLKNYQTSNDERVGQVESNLQTLSSNVDSQLNGYSFRIMSQEAYDAIEHEPNTFYFIDNQN